MKASWSWSGQKAEKAQESILYLRGPKMRSSKNDSVSTPNLLQLEDYNMGSSQNDHEPDNYPYDLHAFKDSGKPKNMDPRHGL